jgi:uroporphyrinogen III methyltransferase / synthase
MGRIDGNAGARSGGAVTATSLSRLRGQRVIVTRSADDCGAWVAELKRRGATALVLPCITTEVIDTPAVRAALATAGAATDWLVFTSRRGVAAFATLHPQPLPRATRLAAVGDATATEARERLGRIDHVGAGGTAAALADSLAARADFTSGTSCVLPLAANAAPSLEQRLTAAGAACVRIDVYRTVPAAAGERKQALSTLNVDKILFASPSAVEGFSNLVDCDVGVGIYTIGPSTTAAARAHGLDVAGQARQPSLQGLVEAMYA